MLAEFNIRQQMYWLLAHAVNPTEDEKRELRAKRGLVFLPIATQSYAELVRAHPKHYQSNEQLYADARSELRYYRPPVTVEVGFREFELALPYSLWRSRCTALQMITAYSDELAVNFPAFRAIGLPATGYANADEAYAQIYPGLVLFKHYSAWCLDNLPGGFAAFAGRNVPSMRFGVFDWPPRQDGGNFGGVPAVVKIGTPLPPR